jgi:hypothetical protein
VSEEEPRNGDRLQFAAFLLTFVCAAASVLLLVGLLVLFGLSAFGVSAGGKYLVVGLTLLCVLAALTWALIAFQIVFAARRRMQEEQTTVPPSEAGGGRK